MELRLPTGELWHVIHPGRMVEGLIELVAMIFASTPQSSTEPPVMLPRCVDIVASESEESVVVGCFTRSKLAFLRHELMTHPDVMIRFVQMAFLRLNSVTFTTSVRYLGLVTELRPSTCAAGVVAKESLEEGKSMKEEGEFMKEEGESMIQEQGQSIMRKESIQEQESIKEFQEGQYIQEQGQSIMGKESKESTKTESIQEQESIKEFQEGEYIQEQDQSIMGKESIKESTKKGSIQEQESQDEEPQEDDAYWLERAQGYAAQILGLDRELIPHMTMELEKGDDSREMQQGMVRCGVLQRS